MPEPTMMWNTAFGKEGTTTGPPLSAARAKVRANAWLAQNRSGGVTADATPLPGYYTIDVTKNGGKIGMLSVNQKTGAVWFHTWHATFLADQDF